MEKQIKENIIVLEQVLSVLRLIDLKERLPDREDLFGRKIFMYLGQDCGDNRNIIFDREKIFYGAMYR